MTHRTKKLLAAIVLLVGLPVYIGVALYIVSDLERPHILVELAIYVALGILWALPFKWLFKGIGRADPNLSATPEAEPTGQEDTPPGNRDA